MRIRDFITTRMERLLTSPRQELGSWARLVRFQIQLWRFCAKRLWQHNVTAMSAALSFRTIFTMIPAIVLAVLVLKSVGVLEDGKTSLREFLHRTGFTQIAVVEQADGADTVLTGEADATSESAPSGEPGPPGDSQEARVVNVADEIESIVARVEEKMTFQRIGPIGVVLLIWTAVTLVTTVERSLNRIFGAQRARPMGKRLLLYWSVLTLGPLLLIVTSYFGERAIDIFKGRALVGWIVVVSGWVGPGIVGVLVVAALYKLMPNTHVRFRSALVGALVAVPLWMAAKWGFAIYVNEFVSTGSLYGALGLLPLFMLWLNVSWLILLFGAELAHTVANLESLTLEEQSRNAVLTPSDALAVAVLVAHAFVHGDGAVEREMLGAQLGLDAETMEKLLEALIEAGILHRVESEDESERFALARPPDAIPVLEILKLRGGSAFRSKRASTDGEIRAAVDWIWESTRPALGDLTLTDVQGRLSGGSRRGPSGVERDV